MVSPSAKRRAVKMSQEEGWSNGAQACRALGLARSSYYRVGRASLESRRIHKEVLELSGKHPRYKPTTLLDRRLQLYLKLRMFQAKGMELRDLPGDELAELRYALDRLRCLVGSGAN